LQERFPKAEYEDVIGLCRLASPADVKEQEYSLNPGRYVGVVIEEDGKTKCLRPNETAPYEKRFLEDLDRINRKIAELQAQRPNALELNESAEKPKNK